MWLRPARISLPSYVIGAPKLRKLAAGAETSQPPSEPPAGPAVETTLLADRFDRPAATRRGRRRGPPGSPVRSVQPPVGLALGRALIGFALFGHSDAARSACAVIDSDGLTPRLAETAAPSITASVG